MYTNQYRGYDYVIRYSNNNNPYMYTNPYRRYEYVIRFSNNNPYMYTN